MTYQQPQPAFPPPANAEPSFFAALFDLSFKNWVTLRIAGILYILTVVLFGLSILVYSIALAMLVGGFLGFLVFAVGFPLFLFLTTLALRLAFEGAVATVAIARNTEALKTQ